MKLYTRDGSTGKIYRGERSGPYKCAKTPTPVGPKDTDCACDREGGRYCIFERRHYHHHYHYYQRHDYDDFWSLERERHHSIRGIPSLFYIAHHSHTWKSVFSSIHSIAQLSLRSSNQTNHQSYNSSYSLFYPSGQSFFHPCSCDFPPNSRFTYSLINLLFYPLIHLTYEYICPGNK